MSDFFSIIITMYIFAVAIIGIEGSKREIGATFATILAVFTTPLIGLIIVLLSRKTELQKEVIKVQSSSADTQKQVLEQLILQNQLLKKQMELNESKESEKSE